MPEAKLLGHEKLDQDSRLRSSIAGDFALAGDVVSGVDNWPGYPAIR